MHLRDAALLVDQVRDAASVFVFRRVACAVRHADLVVGIAQKRKCEFELLREARVLLDRVEAAADDLNILGSVLVGEVPEPGPFGRSAGRVGFRKKPEQGLLSAKIGQLHTTAAMVLHIEIRRRVANFQHR